MYSSSLVDFPYIQHNPRYLGVPWQKFTYMSCHILSYHVAGEFECPYVKVSRCCGLKITSEGYVVTLAKNNHHVLVLNTLYIS